MSTRINKIFIVCTWLCYSVSTDGEELQVKLVKKCPIVTERPMPYPPFENKGYKSTITQDVPVSNPL